MTSTCSRCERRKLIKARGLCKPCWSSAQLQGELSDYPRVTRGRDELLDDYVILRGEGHTLTDIAQRLDMTREALYRALYRAKKDQDPRVTEGART